MKPNKIHKNIIGIYCIKNTINNKVYIGKSICVYTRIRQHITALTRKSDDENDHFINAWYKYGKNNFDYSVLETFELSSEVESIVKLAELKWMNIHKSLNPKFGYNKRADSETSMIVHEETRLKQSNNIKLRNLNQPTLAKEIGRKTSETRTTHNILQYDFNFNLIETFNNCWEISQKYPNYSKSCILNACVGPSISYKGFIWRKQNKETNEIVVPTFRKVQRPKLKIVNTKTNEVVFLSTVKAGEYVGLFRKTIVTKLKKTLVLNYKDFQISYT